MDNQLISPDTLVAYTDSIKSICTRSSTDVSFKTFDETLLKEVSDNMIEINRANNAFGRSNSMVTDKLMSLNMIGATPFHAMKQCLAKIERCRSALKETTSKLLLQKIDLEEYKEKLEKLVQEDQNKYEIARLHVKIEDCESFIADTFLYYEGSLKEIAVYQTSYQQIVKNTGKENWDEVDFLQDEVRHHVIMAFKHAIRDVIHTNTLGMGTLEDLEQFGINPQTALALVKQHVAENNDLIAQQKYPTVSRMYTFLHGMADTFKDSYKDAAVELGLDPDKLIDPKYCFNC